MTDVHLVAHTHWDREWYLTREQYRLRLVDLVDRVLLRMDREPAFTYFHLDGQTIVLEDYLEVRPEQETRLRARIAEGRLLVGPWYVMPDMHLVSGESLVRNLARGHRVAHAFGGVMAAGYLPDPFGHVAQMPQILAGFGLDSAILWRGFGGERAEYLWEAPDGTRVLLLHLPREGYCNALRLPLQPEGERAAAALRVIEHERERSALDVVLLMAGVDHVEPAPALLALAAEISHLPDVDGRLSTLPAYVEAVRSAHASHPGRLETIQGELRAGEDYAPLLPGVLSARLYLKMANARVQNLLERRAEPSAALAWLLGTRYPQGELDYAWRTLLQNHPHDSICGCSIDLVHDECMSRFARASQMGAGIEESAHETLANAVAAPAAGVLRFLAVNTDVHPFTGVVVGEIEVPLETGEPRRAFDLALLERPVAFLGTGAWPRSVTDPDGLTVPFQLLGHEDHLVHFMSRHEPPLAAHVRRFRLAFPATVPACGFLAVDVGFGVASPAPLGGAQAGQSADGRAWLQNERWHIDVNPDGTLDIRDRNTGGTWNRAGALIDEGDVGDEYNYAAPAHERVVTSADAHSVSARVEHAGPLVATLRIELMLPVPRSAREDRRGRSPDLVDIPVALAVTLTTGSPRIDFDLSLSNPALDHRLRVQFPTGSVSVATARSDSAFGVVTRPARRPPPAEFAVEAPVSAGPLQSFVDGGDAASGVTLLGEGLTEYEVSEVAPPGLALTLLRSVGWLSRDDLATRRGNAGPSLPTPGAQCPGPHTFRFAAIPRTAPPAEPSLYAEARRFLAPPRLVSPAGREGLLPRRHAFLEVTSEPPHAFVLSALKRADEREALIVRLFNPGTETVRVRVVAPESFVAIHETDLGERPEGALPIKDGRANIALPPQGIRTLSVELS